MEGAPPPPPPPVAAKFFSISCSFRGGLNFIPAPPALRVGAPHYENPGSTNVVASSHGGAWLAKYDPCFHLTISLCTRIRVCILRGQLSTDSLDGLCTYWENMGDVWKVRYHMGK